MSDHQSILLKVANQVRDHLSFIGRDFCYHAVNEAYAAASGLPPDKVVGSSVADLVGQDVFDSIVRPKLEQCFEGREVRFRYDFQYPTNEGRVYMDVSFLPHRDEQGVVIGATVSARDVTALKRIEDRYARLAHYDTSTNLSNRQLFERELDRSLARSRREKSRFALIQFAVEGLGAVEDELGDDAADAVLKEVAARIQTSIRQNDLAARWGGDEFVVLGESVGDEAAVLILASRLSENLCQAFEVDGGQRRFSVFMGVVVYPDDGEGRNDLLKKADDALHRARFSDTANIRFARELG